MTKVGEVIYDAVINTSGLRKSARDTEQIIKDSADRVEKFASMATKTAGVAAGAMIAAAIKGSAELEQQIGGTEAVFGKYAKDIQKQAQSAFKKAGLSQSEFMQGANKMGSLFQGAGFDIKASMDMSTKSMQRASDIASVMGISTSDALQAVTGMAKGNFTMMDNLGVAMNDTAIEAYALSKGIDKSSSAMTIQEKVGLANQMFLEKTAKYAGNYARENNTLAGSFNTTKKAFEDFLATGSGAEAVATNLTNTVQLAYERAAELVPKIVTGLWTEMNLPMKAFTVVMGGVIASFITLKTVMLFNETFVLFKAGIAGVQASMVGLQAIVSTPMVMPAIAIVAALGAIYKVWDEYNKMKSAVENLQASTKAYNESKAADAAAMLARSKDMSLSQDARNRAFTAYQNIKGRAGGGYVNANTPYLVGENADGSINKTTELFVPRTSGTIVSSSDLQKALNGGRSVNMTNNYTVNNLADAQALSYEIAGKVKFA